jgi:hypothetical protein
MWVIFVDISTSLEGSVVRDDGSLRCLLSIRSFAPSGEPVVRLGVQLLDDYLDFVAARSRPNTVLATADDLGGVLPGGGQAACGGGYGGRVGVRDRPTSRRTGWSPAVVDEAVGMSSRTVARRLSIISGLFPYLHARGDVATTPSHADCPRVGNGRVHGRECRWYGPPGRCRGS